MLTLRIAGSRQHRRAERARAPSRHRLIDREHQRAVARRHAAIEQRAGLLAIGLHVELEPLRRRAALGGGVLDGRGAAGRHHVDRAGRGGAARGRALRLGMEQMMPAGRRHHDRRLDPRAQHARAGVDLDDVAQHARPQLQLAPGGDVFRRRDLVVRAGVAEHPRRRASSCAALRSPAHRNRRSPFRLPSNVSLSLSRGLMPAITEMRCCHARSRGRLVRSDCRASVPCPRPVRLPPTSARRSARCTRAAASSFRIRGTSAARAICKGSASRRWPRTSSGHRPFGGLSRRRRAARWMSARALARAGRQRPTFRSTPTSRTVSPTIPTPSRKTSRTASRPASRGCRSRTRRNSATCRSTISTWRWRG